MREKIYVGDSNLGFGVFANCPIEPREVIFYVTGPVISLDECLQLPDQGENTFQIGLDAYVNPGYPGKFINHSCEPNAGLIDDTCVIAIRQIVPGEEIRFDYSTAMLERLWELDCRCGSPRCRNKVRDFDLLPIGAKQRLLRLGIVQNFIVEALEELSPLPHNSSKITAGNV